MHSLYSKAHPPKRAHPLCERCSNLLLPFSFCSYVIYHPHIQTLQLSRDQNNTNNTNNQTMQRVVRLVLLAAMLVAVTQVSSVGKKCGRKDRHACMWPLLVQRLSSLSRRPIHGWDGEQGGMDCSSLSFRSKAKKLDDVKGLCRQQICWLAKSYRDLTLLYTLKPIHRPRLISPTRRRAKSTASSAPLPAT